MKYLIFALLLICNLFVKIFSFEANTITIVNHSGKDVEIRGNLHFEIKNENGSVSHEGSIGITLTDAHYIPFIIKKDQESKIQLNSEIQKFKKGYLNILASENYKSKNNTMQLSISIPNDNAFGPIHLDSISFNIMNRDLPLDLTLEITPNMKIINITPTKEQLAETLDPHLIRDPASIVLNYLGHERKTRHEY